MLPAARQNGENCANNRKYLTRLQTGRLRGFREHLSPKRNPEDGAIIWQSGMPWTGFVVMPNLPLRLKLVLNWGSREPGTGG
jgi:hypothetical protein